MVIKAIIFDCFGVLVVPGLDALLHDFPDKAVEAQDLELQSDYGYISRQEYNQLASELTGLSVEQFQNRYWKSKVRNQPAFDWLLDLKKTGTYKIGMLSNIGAWWLDDFIAPTEREQLFDAFVLSGEVGMVKPSIEIFELVAERLGVEPSECVMIDDALVNVNGAKRAGMKAILFSTTVQAQADLALLLEADGA